MTTNSAIDWLDAQLQQRTEGHTGRYRYAPGHPKWRGPDQIRPMIEFLSVMDAGQPMRIIPRDYDDPDRLLL
jgi:hypothetical protein